MLLARDEQRLYPEQLTLKTEKTKPFFITVISRLPKQGSFVGGG